MKIHLSKFDIMKLVAEKYDLPYDEIKNDVNQIVSMSFKDSNTSVTWDDNDKE